MNVVSLPGMILLYRPSPKVCTPGANQNVAPGWFQLKPVFGPAGTTIAPGGGVAGPLSNSVLPQICAGGDAGQEVCAKLCGAGSVKVMRDRMSTRVETRRMFSVCKRSS